MRRSTGAARSARPRLRQPPADRVVHARHRHHEAEVDDLDSLVGRGVTVPAVVLVVETAPGRRRVAGKIAGFGHGNRDRMLLAAVAQVGGEGEVPRQPVARERRLAGVAQLGEGACGIRGRTPPSSPIRVRTKSCRHSAINMPKAEKLPGSLGMITLGIEISRAMAAACSGPAPPNAITAVSRGSMPRLTDTARTASDIAPSTIVAIPQAAVTASSPSRSPSVA